MKTIFYRGDALCITKSTQLCSWSSLTYFWYYSIVFFVSFNTNILLDKLKRMSTLYILYYLNWDAYLQQNNLFKSC